MREIWILSDGVVSDILKASKKSYLGFSLIFSQNYLMEIERLPQSNQGCNVLSLGGTKVQFKNSSQPRVPPNKKMGNFASQESSIPSLGYTQGFGRFIT